MGKLTPINSWQLRRLGILADMLSAIIADFSASYTDTGMQEIANFTEKLNEYREFSKKARNGALDVTSEIISGWLSKLEKLEADSLEYIFSLGENDVVEIIHEAGRKEGEKWGKVAMQKKGLASIDARKALLVLNDYLVHGLPTDNTIEVISCERGQITYNLNRCLHSEQFEKRPILAWLLCSSRQAWKDGFFSVLGGIAHQQVTAKCQGDERCMHVITVSEGEADDT